MGVITSVIVIGWTLQFVNRSYRSVEPAAYPVTLAAEPGARTRDGPDGAAYRGGPRGRPGATSPTAPTSWTRPAQVRYRVQEGIGSEKAPAPQATLMSLVTKGILTQQLPWGLVLLGVFTSILMEIIGVPALAFAVGMYLPLESTTPIFLGGLGAQARGSGARRRTRSRTPAPACSTARGWSRAARSWAWFAVALAVAGAGSGEPGHRLRQPGPARRRSGSWPSSASRTSSIARP